MKEKRNLLQILRSEKIALLNEVTRLSKEISQLKQELKKSEARFNLAQYQSSMCKSADAKAVKDGFRQGFRIGLLVAEKGIAKDIETLLEMWVSEENET